MIYITIAIVVIGILVLCLIVSMAKNAATQDRQAEQSFKQFMENQNDDLKVSDTEQRFETDKTGLSS